MGESTDLWNYHIENDLSILPYISAMNLACGFHAGDAHTIQELIDAAMSRGVGIGAHPSFFDREDFGRKEMMLSPEKVYDIVLYQLGALSAFLKVRGTALHHVKPHGALYNMAARDAVLATAICRAVYDFDEDLLLYGLSGSKLISAGTAIGLHTVQEVFADRTYQEDGSLTPRSTPGALITGIDEAVRQVLQMVQEKKVTTLTGKVIPVTADTVCIHSDGEQAVELAAALHKALTEDNIIIRNPGNQSSHIY